MITMEKARKIAAGWLNDISGCNEFTTAYVFFNPRTEHSIGGPDSSVVVLKENGLRCSFMEYITNYGGGELIRRIDF